MSINENQIMRIGGKYFIELNKFENLMKPFGIIEMVRGGSIAIQTNL